MTDTAQAYRNETEAGIALRESGLSREGVFITTKYSGTNGLDIRTSIRNSLTNVSSWKNPIIWMTIPEKHTMSTAWGTVC